MNISNKHKRPIPNRGTQSSSRGYSEVTTYFVDPAEIIAKYGPPICKWRRGYQPR